MHSSGPRQSTSLFLPAVVGVSLTYTCLHLALTEQYARAPWKELLNLSAPRPFVSRLLVPVLARFLTEVLNIPVAAAFAVFEAAAVCAIILAIDKTLAGRVSTSFARKASLLFIFLLAFPYFLATIYRFYYPSDIPALAFTACGLLLLLRSRFTPAFALMLIATLNRETTFIFPLVLFFYHLKRMPLERLFVLTLIFLAGYAAVRCGLIFAFVHNPGVNIEWFHESSLRIAHNLAWLASLLNIITFLASLTFLPLFWLYLYPRIPVDLRRLQWPALLVFLALFFVGNLDEPRIFGEVMLLLYVPIAAALGAPVHKQQSKGAVQPAPPR